jgi:cell wall-associated NlpC family hydrolase
MRDSKDQSNQGTVVENLKSARPGDLAFFETAYDQSSHVGLVVAGGIIHASGRVRLDALDEAGIRVRETGKLTHCLKGIRRIIE